MFCLQQTWRPTTCGCDMEDFEQPVGLKYSCDIGDIVHTSSQTTFCTYTCIQERLDGEVTKNIGSVYGCIDSLLGNYMCVTYSVV